MRMLQHYGQYLQLHVAKNDSKITLLARDEPEMIASGLFIYHMQHIINIQQRAVIFQGPRPPLLYFTHIILIPSIT